MGRPNRRLALLSLVLLAGLPGLAHANTYTVTEKDCMAVPGGLMWAIQQANAHPGRDRIDIAVNFIAVGRHAGDLPGGCVNPRPSEPWAFTVTDSVDIVGNGVQIEGGVGFLSSSGRYNQVGVCPTYNRAYTIIGYGAGLLEVGDYHQDATGLEVTITGVNMTLLTNVALVRKNAKLRIENSTISDIHSVYAQSCNRSVFEAHDGSELALVNSKLSRMNVPFDGFGDTSFPIASSVIFGSNASLLMQGVTWEETFGGLSNWGTVGIDWTGGTAKIVDSRLVDSGGLLSSFGADVQIVSSAFFASTVHHYMADAIISTAGNITAKGSTFYWGSWECTNCPSPGLGFRVRGGPAAVRFESTAIGAPQVHDPLLVGASSYFSSDTYSWIQPTRLQDAAALHAILPNVRTMMPGLPAPADNQYTGSVEAALTPITGPEVPQLIDEVPNAQPGGANQLLSPIDGQAILKDVFGNPRWDAGNGKRNIGAIQTVQAPHLAVDPSAARASTEVPLMWNQPAGLNPAAFIVGYYVYYRPVGSPGSAEQQDFFTGTDILASLKSKVAGLTPGIPYQFELAANFNPVTSPRSNVVIATPSGVPGAPDVTATAGDGLVALSWTTPPDNGAPIVGYVVKYRPVGGTWQPWAFSGTGTSTTVNSLTNGVTYEFEVAAVNSGTWGQGQGPFGTATATPFKLLTLSYPTPVTVYTGHAQDIAPAVVNLTGTPLYAAFGSLPTEITHNTVTGVITVSAAASAGSYPLSFLLRASGPPVQVARATLTVNVVSSQPDLRLIYPDLIGVPVGSGPYSLPPTFRGFTGPPTFSLVSPSVLPPGLTLNGATGVISGTPTTATSGFFSPTVRAEFPGQTPEQVRQNVLLIEIVPLLSYPPGNGVLGNPMTLPATISPTVAPGTFSVVGGALQTGLSINPATGTISGTPTIAVSSQVTVRFASGPAQQPQTVEANVLITVAGYQIVTTYPAGPLTIGQPAHLVPTTSGGKGTVTYSLTRGQLPPGLTLDPVTGEIRGTPTGPPGAAFVEITVSDQYTSTTTAVVLTVDLAPNSIPTLSEMGLAILALGIALAGIRLARGGA